MGIWLSDKKKISESFLKNRNMMNKKVGEDVRK